VEGDQVMERKLCPVVEDITDEFESVAVIEAQTPPVIGANEGTSPAEDVPESSESPGAGDTRVDGANDGLEFYREGIAVYLDL
jgi:hypothetical protein